MTGISVGRCSATSQRTTRSNAASAYGSGRVRSTSGSIVTAPVSSGVGCVGQLVVVGAEVRAAHRAAVARERGRDLAAAGGEIEHAQRGYPGTGAPRARTASEDVRLGHTVRPRRISVWPRM